MPLYKLGVGRGMELSFQNSMDDDDLVAGNLTAHLTPTESSESRFGTKCNKPPKYLRNAPLRITKHPTEKSLVWSFLVSVVAIIFAIVLSVPFMIVVTVLLYPLAIFLRFAVNNCCQCFKKQSCKCHVKAVGLTPNDAAWLHANPLGINVSLTLLFFEKGVGLTKIKDMFLRRVVLAENNRGQRSYPRFSQKVLPLTAGYCWMNDDKFDIDNHVYTAPTTAQTRQGLETYLGALVNQKLHLDRPPWEVQVLVNYSESEDTVLIVRTHHCLSDAISLIKILKRSLSDVHSSSNLKPRFGGTAYPLNVFRAVIVGPMSLLSWLCCFTKDCNFFNHSQTLSGIKLLAWSDDISLSKVVRIKQVSRSTLNDVVLAALSGSLRSCFQKNGVTRPYDMKVNFII